MASVIEDLISILEEEQQIYEQLIPIASEKTSVIIQNNLESLQKITEQEQEAIDKVTALEKKRSEVIFNIAIILNKDAKNIKLTDIINVLDSTPKEKKQLSILHDRLKATVQRLVQINQQNKSLIEQSLEMIEFNMNLIQSTRMSQGNNYSRGAVTIDSPMMQPVGSFDAKQ
ncbi:MAG: flagellar protein FlgN [Lachnospiraceae bacterium]|nr:flagellar protein FlgN [Lachnospiraceae bacterium]